MSFALTDDEYRSLQNIPEIDLVHAAADLSIVPPAEIDIRELINRIIPAMVERAREEGLPFSKYDRDDLEDLDATERGAIAQLQGLSSSASVTTMLKAGQKVYKAYHKNRPNNPVALLLPTLLHVVARAAHESR